MPELLKANGLSKHFGGLIAVDKVDFAVDEGTATGIIGPNGSGKTTFFNLLSGFFPPTNGTISFLGKDITGLPSNKRVMLGMARTFQLVSVFNTMTVWENLVLSSVRFDQRSISPGRFMISSAKNRDLITKCAHALHLVGLEKDARKPASELSYGSKRMLEIGIALSLRPRLLLLDEPLSGLSDFEIAEVMGTLHRIKKNLTLIIIEHKLSRIVDLVEHLCVLNEGSLICQGRPERVLRDSAVRECYWGKDDAVVAS
jgi:branched-chain amino acid transport system ATP-binding protein